jgi:hypothetical protein
MKNAFWFSLWGSRGETSAAAAKHGRWSFLFTNTLTPDVCVPFHPDIAVLPAAKSRLD